jgi:hypothetical protein
MNIRSFEWQDLFLLNSYRNRGLFLDSTRVLIHGPALVPLGVFVPFLGLASRIYTYRCDGPDDTDSPLIGQVTHVKGASYARLSFLAPENAMEIQSVSVFSDHIAAQMGAQGAFHILAEIDENSPVYPLLRRAGFAIYARQRIWRLDGAAFDETEAVNWKPCRVEDTIGVRSLYCNVVPGLVQQVEPLPKKRLSGFVHYQKSDICAYVELKYGRYGIWVQPYVHPDAQSIDQQMVQLLSHLHRRFKKTLYICVRSYQSWLESAVEAFGAVPGPRQTVMVRHLTLNQRVKQTYPLPAINGTHAEPTAPLVHYETPRFAEPSEGEQNPGTGSIP